MPRVLPSQVVAFIGQAFPWAETRPHPLLEDTRTFYTQAEAVNKKVVPP